MPLVKICGLSTLESVQVAQNGGADFLGFVFFEKSPRNITPAQAAALAAGAKVPTVAVTVDPDDEMLAHMLAVYTPQYIQLHGHESPERVLQIRQKFGIPIIKAFSVTTADDIKAAHTYEECADMLLFDAKANTSLPGGNGIAFDWQLLAGQSFSKQWFLSGGLNADNVEQAIRISGAHFIDVSSGIESAPGVKSSQRIEQFLQTVKSIQL